jgi:hypothetical protein
LCSTFFSHGHLALKEMHSDFKSEIPRPPNFRDLHTFGQAIRQ